MDPDSGASRVLGRKTERCLMAIQRWEPWWYREAMTADDEGEYVLHADHLAALSAVEVERDAARRHTDQWRARSDTAVRLMGEAQEQRNTARARVAVLEGLLGEASAELKSFCKDIEEFTGTGYGNLHPNDFRANHIKHLTPRIDAAIKGGD